LGKSPADPPLDSLAPEGIAEVAIPLLFPCRIPKIPLPRRLAFGS
jgi:hypothetical protein